MLMLSGGGHIKPKKTFSWLLGVSGTNKLSLKSLPNPYFTELFFHPTILILSGLGHINPKNTFSWLSGVSETHEIKPKKASKPLFYPVIPL